MKDIATFVAESGQKVAIIFESEDKSMYRVDYGQNNSAKAMKFFKSEHDATAFAEQYAFGGQGPTLLNESYDR